VSQPTLIDCNGLAGFMSLGFVQAGMTMTTRTGSLNFGNALAEANRHHLGNQWGTYFSDEPAEWPVSKADVVAGCPPCSGWSVWSGPTNRGPDSKAHEHTRAFMRYAGRVKPKVIAFECVQQAYTQGRDVMNKYRLMVEEVSGKKYDLYHVKHNNLLLGGFSYRPRYFWVAVESGLKFGINVDEPSKLPRIMDIIGDLAKMPQAWEKQRYVKEPSSWVKHLKSKDGLVNGHIGRDNINAQRVLEVFKIIGNENWHGNGDLGSAAKKMYEMNGNKFPQNWIDISDRILRKEFKLGFSQPYRWKEDHWCNVLTGSALDHVVHPTEPRLITHRESARMQGLPDDWDIEGVRDYSSLPAVWGKAVPVQAARWLGDAIVAALEGQPSGPQGELIGEREWLLDTDKTFSRHAAKKRWYPDKIQTVVSDAK
jgi:site-specific DNA-cytosine methylase